MSLAAVALPFLTGQPLAALQGAQFELSQIGAVTVPSDLVPLGAVFPNDTTALVWGAGGLFRIRAGGIEEWLPFAEALDPKGLRIADGAQGHFEIVDALGSGFVTIDSEGRILGRTPINIAAPIGQVVAIEGGWLIESLEPDAERLTVWRVAPNGAAVRLDSMFPSWGDASPPSDAGLRITGTGSELFVGEVGSPHRVWRSPADGNRLAFELMPGSIEAVAEAAAHAFPEDATAALPIVGLDRGFLYQLSDLTGDARFVAVLDLEGHFVRATVWNVAMGLIAADIPSRRVIALRDTGELEVVLYRWRWRGGDADPETILEEDPT